MSNWLMNDEPTDGGYLGMDDPAMPDGAPTPPSAPGAVAMQDPGTDAPDWLGGGAPQDGRSVGAAPVMDDQGDWFGGETAAAPEEAVMPGLGGGTQQYADPYAVQTPATPAPMAMSQGGEINVMAPQLPQVTPSPRAVGGTRGELSNLVLDVEVQVEVGLGNAALTVEEFLEMGRGSVVELDTPIDAPIELKVRGKLIARGQLVSINGSYGMRIVEMLNEEN